MRQRSKEGLENHRATSLKLPIYLMAETAPTLSAKSADLTRLDLLSKRSVSSGHLTLGTALEPKKTRRIYVPIA